MVNYIRRIRGAGSDDAIQTEHQIRQPLDNEEEVEHWTEQCNRERAREQERGRGQLLLDRERCGCFDVWVLLSSPLLYLVVGAGISPRSNAATHSHTITHLLMFWPHAHNEDNHNHNIEGRTNTVFVPHICHNNYNDKNTNTECWTLGPQRLMFN